MQPSTCGIELTREMLTHPRRRLNYPFPPEVSGYTDRGEPAVIMVAYGGGINSTACLVLLHWLGRRPDAILFADTGGEKPETYAHLEIVSAWCTSIGFPAIHTVRRAIHPERQKHAAKYHNLETECLVKRMLPSIAYFRHSCAEKWKQQPQHKWARAWAPAAAAWEAGKRVVKIIGYDADESRRAKIFGDTHYAYWYPLLEYDWGRDECTAAIRLAGLPVPPKSSCFFCPSSKPHEIFALQRDHPDLLDRALAMEANARLTSIKGLGKHDFAWRDLIAGRVSLPTVTGDTTPCMCYDGSGD